MYLRLYNHDSQRLEQWWFSGNINSVEDVVKSLDDMLPDLVKGEVSKGDHPRCRMCEEVNYELIDSEIGRVCSQCLDEWKHNV